MAKDTDLDPDPLDDSDGEDGSTLPTSQSQQLSLSWPEDVRGVPNVALRGALFSINQEREVYRKRQRVATVDGYEVRVKGERFNQRDLDLWEMLLHLARERPGKQVLFSAGELLKSLDRDTGGADYEELKEDIARLMSTYVEITCASLDITFAGHLVANVVRQESTQNYALYFDNKIRKLFDSGYSHIDWEIRRKLRKNQLAQWLHGNYSSHAKPVPYKVATLKALCGSKAERLTDFRKALRVALEKMKDVGAITSSEIDPETDLVKIRRKATASQMRHLTRKQTAQNDKDFSNNGEFDFGANGN